MKMVITLEAAVILVWTLCTVVLEAAILFPHDSATSLPVIDDSSVPVTLTSPYFFHGSPHTEIYITENGMVSFDGGFYGGISHPLSNTWIAPFGADVYQNTGEMNYRIFTGADTDELAIATDLVAGIYPDDNFQATEVFVVTWLNVKSSATSTAENSFQLALTTDGVATTYAIFLYDTIEWFPAVIGASAGDSSTFYYVCETDKKETTFLHLKSNSQCATQGTVVLRVDLSTWTQPGYTCTRVYATIPCAAKPGVAESNRDSRCGA